MYFYAFNHRKIYDKREEQLQSTGYILLFSALFLFISAAISFAGKERIVQRAADECRFDRCRGIHSFISHW